MNLVKFFSKILVQFALIGLLCYRYALSPVLHTLFGPHARCRFHPSCSEYSRQSYLAHGFIKGTWLTFIRILKCQPFHPGGEDPVPKNFAFFSKKS